MTADRWIRRFHEGAPGAPRLVCFPYAGGSASYYFGVSAALRPAIEVLAVQYPGRQDRLDEPVIEDIELLAERVAAALADGAGRPTAFFGHSMGALVAYEVARRWERQGTGPTHLYASGRRAPSLPGDDDAYPHGDAALVAEVTALGGPSTDLLAEPDLAELLLPSIRGDYAALERYRHRPGPPLRCPVTVLTGDADPKVSLAEARGWAAHTTGRFELRVFPGGHFYLGEQVPRVLDVLRGSTPARG